MTDSPFLPERVVVPQGVLFEELTGEVVLLNLSNERYYSLDDVGSRMWSLLKEDGHVAKVVERMRAEYDVDEATLRQDLALLIEKLRSAGLLTVEPASPGGDGTPSTPSVDAPTAADARPS